MVINGKVIFIAQERSGVSTRTGQTWKSLEFVIETNERYPVKIAFTIFGEDNITKANLKMGENVDVVFYPESHEYNVALYTELRCNDICQNGISRFAQAQMFR